MRIFVFFVSAKAVERLAKRKGNLQEEEEEEPEETRTPMNGLSQTPKCSFLSLSFFLSLSLSLSLCAALDVQQPKCLS
jgi:hypothetical protein